MRHYYGLRSQRVQCSRLRDGGERSKKEVGARWYCQSNDRSLRTSNNHCRNIAITLIEVLVAGSMSVIACYQQLAIGVHFCHVAIGRDSKICGSVVADELRGCRRSHCARVRGTFNPFARAAHSRRSLDVGRDIPSPFNALAIVKAMHLSLRAGDEAEVRIWQSIVAWCLLVAAMAFNLFSYVVIARTLR